MVVNKNKVILLPKSVKQDGYQFVCPCPVCTDKVQRDEMKYIGLQEVKNTIEDIIDNTSLYRKDFQIDISYSIDNYEKKLSNVELVARMPELEKIILFTNSLLLFCDQFNKNYRHPLMCELRENINIVASQIGGYMSTYDGKTITNQRLWDLQSLISMLNGISEILTDVHKEEIFQSRKIDSFIKKLKDTRRQSGINLKTMFIDGLHSQDVQPHEPQQGFSIEYGY